MKTFQTKNGTELPLINLKGKDYLQVQHRLVWFREERPTWSIETDYIASDDKSSFAKATVRDEAGRIIATAHKFEEKAHFQDHKEKSETGAIGRALALIGYGTQFAPEIEEGERIVDAPVCRPIAQPEIKNVTVASNVTGFDYVIPFGKKFKGRKLSEVDEQEVRGYLAWLEAQANKDGKPMSQEVESLVDAVDRFYGSM